MNSELKQIHEKIQELQQRRREIYASMSQQPVPDYTFRTKENAPIRLSELFGSKNDLIVIHNMGRQCVYCTLWADGFNGIAPHLEDRTAFVVISPDDPAVMSEFAHSRGWRFRMASAKDSDFPRDMGMMDAEGYWPGISAFRKQPDGGIVRGAWSYLGPGDPFCSLWHIFDMLPEGSDGWEAQYHYESDR